MNAVNRIGDAEQERVGLFAEEMGEALQVLGKILRHGLDSYHPDMPLLSNANLLELEAGHVLAALDLLVECGTLKRKAVESCRLEKLEKLRSWLHCSSNLEAVEAMLGQPQPERHLLKGSQAKSFLGAARAMIDDARADYRRQAAELLKGQGGAAEAFAAGLESAIGEVSAADALDALRRYLLEKSVA